MQASLFLAGLMAVLMATASPIKLATVEQTHPVQAHVGSLGNIVIDDREPKDNANLFAGFNKASVAVIQPEYHHDNTETVLESVSSNEHAGLYVNKLATEVLARGEKLIPYRPANSKLGRVLSEEIRNRAVNEDEGNAANDSAKVLFVRIKEDVESQDTVLFVRSEDNANADDSKANPKPNIETDISDAALFVRKQAPANTAPTPLFVRTNDADGSNKTLFVHDSGVDEEALEPKDSGTGKHTGPVLFVRENETAELNETVLFVRENAEINNTEILFVRDTGDDGATLFDHQKAITENEPEVLFVRAGETSNITLFVRDEDVEETQNEVLFVRRR